MPVGDFPEDPWDRLLVAGKKYFEACDNATAHGKTRWEFRVAAEIAFLCREQLRAALDEVIVDEESWLS